MRPTRSRAPRIALMLHHGLGDLIMALPLLDAVERAIGPDGALLVAVKSELERELLALRPELESEHVIVMANYRRQGMRGLLRAVGAIRSFRASHLLAPHATSCSRTAVFLSALGARRVYAPATGLARVLGMHAIASRPREHKVHYYARFAEAAGIAVAPSSRTPRLEIQRQSTPALARTLVIAPGSGELERHKRWPPARWSSFIALALGRHPTMEVELTGSRGELPLLHEIAAGLDYRERVRILAGAPLRDLASSFAGASCVVTGCSGSAHLAAAVGAPVLALYGPTNPGYTGPYTPNVRVVRLGYACSPCYRRGFTTGCGTPVCMEEMEPALVAEQLQALMDGAPGAGLPWAQTTTATAPDRRLAGAQLPIDRVVSV